MNIYIYVDDIREDDTFFNHLDAFEGSDWVPIICRTYSQTINYLSLYNGRANIIVDLDHDLGEGNENEFEPSGYEICKWIVENQVELIGFHLHSMNVVGLNNMRQLLTHYGYKEI